MDMSDPTVAPLQRVALSDGHFASVDVVAGPETQVLPTKPSRTSVGTRTEHLLEDGGFYDLSHEDIAAAMAEWARRGEDWFAHAYDLTLKAERCSQRIAVLCRAATLPRLLLGQLRALPLRYHRAALTANAHQSYTLAVALRKGRQPGTEHDPDVFRPDPRLMDRAHAILFRRINCAHGHGGIYS